MTAIGLLDRVVSGLDGAGIPFMLTGSMAAAVHGAGRATMDIDLVIEANGQQLRALVEGLTGPDLYLSADASVEALVRESMFNVIDVMTGWKADLIIRKSRPFSRSEFARRQDLEFEGRRLWVASLEDLMVAKLEWARLGGSVRQLEDVAALLRVAAGDFDRSYVNRWIVELGLSEQWEVAQRGSGRT